MPGPINLDFDSHISQTSKESNASHDPTASLTGGAKSLKRRRTKNPISSPVARPAFWNRQLTKFKEDVRVSGTMYNIGTGFIITFVAVMLILLVFRPPLVTYLPEPTTEFPKPSPCISWMSLFIWSLIMASLVAVVSFFTRPKSAPTYTLDN